MKFIAIFSLVLFPAFSFSGELDSYSELKEYKDSGKVRFWVQSDNVDCVFLYVFSTHFHGGEISFFFEETESEKSCFYTGINLRITGSMDRASVESEDGEVDYYDDVVAALSSVSGVTKGVATYVPIAFWGVADNYSFSNGEKGYGSENAIFDDQGFLKKIKVHRTLYDGSVAITHISYDYIAVEWK